MQNSRNRSVGLLLICVCGFFIWQTRKFIKEKEFLDSQTVPRIRQYKVKNPVIVTEDHHSEKVSDGNSQIQQTHVGSHQRLQVPNQVTNVTRDHSEGGTEEKRYIEKTKVTSNQNIWSTRVAELRAGCAHNQTKIAISGQAVPRSVIARLVVNDKYKFMFCRVPKIASTNILKVLLALDGHMDSKRVMELKNHIHEIADLYLKPLHEYTNSEIEFRLQNYKKVIFVRDPLERLVSAYRNRFGNKKNKISFPEFVQYVIDLTMKKDSYFDVHWRRVFDLCSPCQVSYDIIGKYETIDEDMRLFLKDIGADDVHLPDRSTLYSQPKSKDVLFDHYKQITLAQIESLWNYYYVDAIPFEYKFQSFGASRR